MSTILLGDLSFLKSWLVPHSVEKKYCGQNPIPLEARRYALVSIKSTLAFWTKKMEETMKRCHPILLKYYTWQRLSKNSLPFALDPRCWQLQDRVCCIYQPLKSCSGLSKPQASPSAMTHKSCLYKFGRSYTNRAAIELLAVWHLCGTRPIPC